MASSPQSGVAIAEADAKSLAGRMERALQAAGENENVENLLLGLGAAALCFLLGYAIVLLTKFQIGLFSIALG